MKERSLGTEINFFIDTLTAKMVGKRMRKDSL